MRDAERITKAAKLVAKATEKHKVVAVISAMGKTTDELLGIAKAAAQSQDHVDDIIAMGERTSARVFTSALAKEGIKAGYLDVEDPDWPLITDEKHGDANVMLHETKERAQKSISARLEKLDVCVLPGFIGKTKAGRVTTIGRGGSDSTAYVVGGALNAERIILVSDVSGIMSADPKLVDAPRRIEEISVEKLVGLADSGVKFIHKKSLSYKPKHVDVKLISNQSESIEADGTRITGAMPDLEVEAISKEPAAAITIVGKELSSDPATMVELFNQVASEKSSLLGFSANHDAIVLYCLEKDAEKLSKKLHAHFLSFKQMLGLSLRKDLAVLRINGIGLQETPGSMARVADALTSQRINIFGEFTVMSQIFVLVPYSEEKRARELVSHALDA